MGQLGLGVMIQALRGFGEYAGKYYGREITHATIKTRNEKSNDSSLMLTFADGVTVRLSDEGQSCCEMRYMTCDDDVSDLVGGLLVLIESTEGDEKGTEYGEVHESAFVKVITNKSAITLATHVEHNGYYGGFALRIRETKGESV